MKQLVLLLLLGIFLYGAQGQQTWSYEKHMDPIDSIYFSNLPKLPVPEGYSSGKAKDLPSFHDNSLHPFFRPIFSQYGWSCGQASSIGYAFTYELNRVRNTSASLEENQYPPMFTFNFFNRGEDGVGVSYLYTLDAIKQNGNPSVLDYGGMGESLTDWVSGYDTYYNGMFNRVEEVYALDVGTVEGLQNLKYYLYDHLEGSEYGGVVNFYTDLASFTTLPEGTPEAGKSVITEFGPYTGHAMTFLGWNDSIRWDYNNDGMYTNHLDINEDGVVNLKDWEIGGVLLANSWGDDWADSGFCYVMYNVLAREKLDGGIWNKQVNVIKVREGYEPKLTARISLTHDSREKLKITVAVANDTNNIAPEHVLEFPVFNYQGGNHYMLGTDTSNNYKTIEFGLDITPILSYVEPGVPARFFILVDEYDPQHQATGSVNSFSLMDYTTGGMEISSPQSNQALVENGTTSLSVVHSLSWDKVTIESDALPAFTPGQAYTHQFSATGGTTPYDWEIAPDYSFVEYGSAYPNVTGPEITPPNKHEGFAVVPLDFEFPFYDRMCDTLLMYVDGFLTPDTINYPYPYPADDQLVFKNEALISVFQNESMFISNQPIDGMWYEGDTSHASFRWMAKLILDGIWCQVDLTVRLYPDGTIEMYIDNYVFPYDPPKVTGVSYGDGVNYLSDGRSFASPTNETVQIDFTPLNFPCETTIDGTGLMTFDPSDDGKIYSIPVRVTDADRISDTKFFQLSDGLTFDYSILSGDNSQIDYGDTASIDFVLTNGGSSDLNNLEMLVQTSDPYVQLTDDFETIGPIAAGNSIDLQEAISLKLLPGVPNKHNFQLLVKFVSDENTWEGRMNLTGYAPEVSMGAPIVADGDNYRLDPGETTQLIIPISNQGNSPAVGVAGSLLVADTLVSLDPPQGTLQYGTVAPFSMAYDTITVSVDEDAPHGHVLNFDVALHVEPDMDIEDSFDLLVGRFPVLVVDLDPDLQSGPFIKFALEDLNVIHDYITYLPNELDDYLNLFVTLGRQFENHVLTEAEGQRLADFLESGGNIYMEGGMTWYDDPETAVHPMFYIDTQYLGWHLIDSVFGMEGTFLNNMYFDYEGEAKYYNYHLVPQATSYSILHASDEVFNFGIAYPGEDYKTVGTTLDFGALVEGPVPSTQNHFLAAILEFFDFEVNLTWINDRALEKKSLHLSCYPNPFKDNLDIRFSLTKSRKVSYRIFNINGKLETASDRAVQYDAGTHSIPFKLDKLSPGIYFCTFITDTGVETVKIIKTQ